jgi:hypothetical protein
MTTLFPHTIGASRIRPWLRVLILSSVLSVADTGCIPSDKATNQQPARTDTDTWSDADALPVLRQKLITPVAEVSKFKVSTSDVTFNEIMEPKADDPFPSDEEAVVFARAWIERHFGRLPSSTSIAADKVLHSTSGHEQPAFDWDRGHTITFRERFHGMPTDGFAIVYVPGRNELSVHSHLYSYEPIPDSAKKVIKKDAAVAAWRALYAKRPDAKEALPVFDKKVSPKLKYVWSSVANRGHDDDIIAPTWVLDDEGLLMVDGHTGEPWYND